MYLRVTADIIGIRLHTNQALKLEDYVVHLLTGGTATLIPKSNESGYQNFLVQYEEEIYPADELVCLIQAYCDDVEVKSPSGKSKYQNERLTSFLRQSKYSASKRIRSFISVLRWRFNINSNAKPIATIQAYIATDASRTWIPIHVDELNNPSDEENTIHSNRVIEPDFKEYLGSSDSEPIGHELLREAKEIISVSKRGALVLGVAAVEVRVKELIGEAFPSVNWLITEIPSPPVPKIFKGYLPELFEEQRYAISAFKSSEHMKRIEKAIEIRNSIAHKGADAEDEGVVTNFLYSVEQYLWFCDYLAGYSWSREYFDYLTEKCFFPES